VFNFDTPLSTTQKYRVIVLRSKEGIKTSDFNLDTLASIVHEYKFNKQLTLNSELALDNHKAVTAASNTANRDSAMKTALTYRPGPLFVQIGRRSIGPNFNPTVLGTYTEKDRDSMFTDIRYFRPSQKFGVSTFFDRYHDNLHNSAAFNNTNTTNNSRSSMTLNYGWILPKIMLGYNKTYTDADQIIDGTESTNANLNLIKDFHDTDSFTGNRIVGAFSRYDIDRISTSQGTTSSSKTDYMLRTDNRSWTISTRYKAAAQFSFNTSVNKSYSYSLSNISTRVGVITINSTASSISNSKTNTDTFGAQFNIVPFKFITNYNYRRSARKTYTETSGFLATLSAAPLEFQHTLTFMYYINQQRKIHLELSSYDKEYRESASVNRGYVEKTAELGYTVDF